MAYIGIPSNYNRGSQLVGSPRSIAPRSSPKGGTPLKRPTPQQVKNRMSPGRLRKIASKRKMAAESRY
jgi:hypothetical protein